MSKKQVKTKEEQIKELTKYRDMVLRIANMGANMKPEIIDWNNIGKNSVHLCRELLRPKCEKCGK